MTRSTVRVIAPLAPYPPNNPMPQAIVRWINTHYQLYGRRLVLTYARTNPGGMSSPSEQRALAAEIAARRPFAVAGDGGVDDPSTSSARLAAHGIIVMGTGATPAVPAEFLAARAPYLWAIRPAMDTIQRDAAAFACRALVRRTAGYAGDPELAHASRTFIVGYSRPRSGHRKAITQPLVDGLRACGATVRAVELSLPSEPAALQQYLQLKREGWTTIIWTSEGSFMLDQAMTAAEQAAYHPEWFALGAGGFDRPGEHQIGAPASQRAHLFGLRMRNKSQPDPQAPAVQVVRDGGADPHKGNNREQLLTWYETLTLLAAGIQTAGPHLTPATFGRGLEVTRFPNPGGGGAPDYQATVGFNDRDHAAIDDYALVWWSDTAPDPENTVSSHGGFCYADRGRRWNRSTWPTSIRLFAGPCR